MPAHVVGIHAVGEVTKQDIKNVLIPHLDDKVKQYGELNYLLVLETHIKNFTAGALLHDMKAGLKHYGRWKKIAVVTEQKGVKWFSDVFGVFIPGKSKGFPLERLDDAVMWISAKD